MPLYLYYWSHSAGLSDFRGGFQTDDGELHWDEITVRIRPQVERSQRGRTQKKRPQATASVGRYAVLSLHLGYLSFAGCA